MFRKEKVESMALVVLCNHDFFSWEYPGGKQKPI